MTDPARNPHPPSFVRNLFAAISVRYDLANHLLSGGLDYVWRARASRLVRSWRPRTLLDLATGSGDLALSLGTACPDAFVVAADFCLPMLAQAGKKSVPNLVAADGMRLPFGDGLFDVVTVAFGLRNMSDCGGALREMARVLAPGGHVLVLDFSVPPPPLRAPYRFYLHRVLPLLAGWLTGDKSAYQYLGATIEHFPSGTAMEAILHASGFSGARSRPLTGGIVTLYEAEKKAD